jgi:hypothetical protein
MKQTDCRISPRRRACGRSSGVQNFRVEGEQSFIVWLVHRFDADNVCRNTGLSMLEVHGQFIFSFAGPSDPQASFDQPF